MRRPWLLFVTFVASGCSSAPAPDCASVPDLSRLTHSEQIALKHSISAYSKDCHSEQIALKHSISAYSKDCHSSQYQCAFRLARNKRNELLVTTSFLYPDKDSGHCLQPVGGSKINVYDSHGRFQRAVLSL